MLLYLIIALPTIITDKPALMILKIVVIKSILLE